MSGRDNSRKITVGRKAGGNARAWKGSCKAHDNRRFQQSTMFKKARSNRKAGCNTGNQKGGHKQRDNHRIKIALKAALEILATDSSDSDSNSDSEDSTSSSDIAAELAENFASMHVSLKVTVNLRRGRRYCASERKARSNVDDSNSTDGLVGGCQAYFPIWGAQPNPWGAQV